MNGNWPVFISNLRTVQLLLWLFYLCTGPLSPKIYLRYLSWRSFATAFKLCSSSSSSKNLFTANTICLGSKTVTKKWPTIHSNSSRRIVEPKEGYWKMSNCAQVVYRPKLQCWPSAFICVFAFHATSKNTRKGWIFAYAAKNKTMGLFMSGEVWELSSGRTLLTAFAKYSKALSSNRCNLVLYPLLRHILRWLCRWRYNWLSYTGVPESTEPGQKWAQRSFSLIHASARNDLLRYLHFGRSMIDQVGYRIGLAAGVNRLN